VKTKLITILLWTAIVVPAQLFSEVPQSGRNSSSLQFSTTAGAPAEFDALADVLAVPSATPRGPQDLLQDYDEAMALITQQFSGKVAAIAGAVQRGELSREQGEDISAEQYQMAQMQFSLLSALREMLGQDLARAAATPRSTAKPEQESEVVMVALPFSSLQLNSSVIEYLDLSSAQVSSIQEVMSEERQSLKPLMAQLQTTREQLLAVSEQGQAKNAKEVKTLAALQARNLTKLIVANSQMRTRIYKLLSPQQQKKLDEFQKSTGPALGGPAERVADLKK
jgi:Spy/CpxP family protein refolding chaperone